MTKPPEPDLAARKDIDSVESNIRHASWAFATKLAALAIRLVRNIIIARVLGPTERGILAVLMAIPEMFSTLGAGGLFVASSYFGARSTPEKPYAAALLSLCLGIGALLLAIVLVFFEFPGFFKGYYDEARDYRWLVAIVTALFVSKLVFSGMLTGLGRVTAFNFLRLAESAIPLAGFLLLWAAGTAPLAAALIAWGTAYFLINAFALSDFGRRRELAGWFDRVRLKAIASFSLRTHADRAAQIIMRRSDYFFLSAYAGAAATGYYAIATIGAELILSVSEAVNVPLTRRLLKARTASQIHIAITVGRLIACVTAAGAVALALLAGPVIVALFGQSFAPAAPALAWLAPGVVALAVGSVFRLELLGQEKPALVSIITTSSAVVCLALNFWLIPVYGIVGAAIASSCSYGLMSGLFIISAMRNANLPLTALFVMTADEKLFWKSQFKRRLT